MERIRQFYINFTDKMNVEDYLYVESILTKDELILFKNMLKSEQKHSVRVAKSIEDMINYIVIDDVDIVTKKNELIRAGLLHDVGKATTKVNIFEKSIIVILNKVTKGNLRNINNKKIDCYYNHAKYSYNFLKDVTDSEIVLNVARNHHSKTEDKFVKFFQYIDDRN